MNDDALNRFEQIIQSSQWNTLGRLDCDVADVVSASYRIREKRRPPRQMAEAYDLSHQGRSAMSKCDRCRDGLRGLSVPPVWLTLDPTKTRFGGF